MAVSQGITGSSSTGSPHADPGVWIVFRDALGGIKDLTRLDNGTNGVTPSRKLKAYEFLSTGDVDGDLVPDCYVGRPGDGEEMFLSNRAGFISFWRMNADGTVKSDTKIARGGTRNESSRGSL